MGPNGVFGERCAYNFYYISIPKKISFVLYLLSLVMVNDMCNEHAIKCGVMQILTAILNDEEHDVAHDLS